MKKILIIATSLLFLFHFSKAQITFEKTFGVTGENSANDVRLTNDGGYIIVGTANFTGSTGDIFLIKLNGNGDTLWTRLIGGTGIDQGNTIRETADGGYIIAGSTTSFGAGATDAYLVKTDADGFVAWSKSYGGASGDAAYGIVQTPDGGYVFSGMEKQSGLNGSAHLVKVDAAGNVLWSKTFGSNLRKNFAYSLHQTADRGFIIGGWENLNLGVNDDFCLIKTDSNGTKEWYKSYGDVERDQNYSVYPTSDGGYIMAGVTFSSSFFEVNVVRADAAGNLVWTKNIGGPGADYAYAITGTSDGGFVFCGSTSSFGAMNQGYVVKLDGSGNIIWSKMMTGTEWTGFFAIQEAHDGGLIMAGTRDRIYSAAGGLYVVKTDADGNSGCNTDVTSSVFPSSILVGAPIAIGTSTQTVFSANPGTTSGTAMTTICSSCVPVTWYQDADGDTYGNAGVTLSSCTQPAGYVADLSDCDDANANVHPGAADICNGMDDNCNSAIDENAISATVTPNGNVSACKGSSLILTANGGSGISYQWYRNSNPVSGATNQAFSVKKTAGYYVTESNEFNCTSTSEIVNATVWDLPQATITPLGDLNICQTGFVDLQANAGTGLTYQWKKGSNIIMGETSQIYTATKTGTYKVIVTDANGCSKTSLGIKVTKSCKGGIILPESVPETFQCYPNPSEGTFIIELQLGDASSGSATIEIFNKLNQKVHISSAHVIDGKLKESLESGLPDGMYTIKVSVGNITLSRSLVIQH